MENIRKIWSRGTPLSEVFDQFRLIEEDNLASGFSLGPGLRRAADTLAARTKGKAISAFRRALVSENITGFGIRNVDGKRVVEKISSDFWVAATFKLTEDSAWQPGLVYSEISIEVPSLKNSLRDTRRETPFLLNQPDKYPKPAGATSYQDEREHVVLACYDRYPDFEKWSFKQRLEEARKVATQEYPDRNWERGFGRTSLYETIKTLKARGRLPSENVR